MKSTTVRLINDYKYTLVNGEGRVIPTGTCLEAFVFNSTSLVANVEDVTNGELEYVYLAGYMATLEDGFFLDNPRLPPREISLAALIATGVKKVSLEY